MGDTLKNDVAETERFAMQLGRLSRHDFVPFMKIELCQKHSISESKGSLSRKLASALPIHVRWILKSPNKRQAEKLNLLAKWISRRIAVIHLFFILPIHFLHNRVVVLF